MLCGRQVRLYNIMLYIDKYRSIPGGISSSLNVNSSDLSLTPWVNQLGSCVLPCSRACTLFCREVNMPGTCQHTCSFIGRIMWTNWNLSTYMLIYWEYHVNKLEPVNIHALLLGGSCEQTCLDFTRTCNSLYST